MHSVDKKVIYNSLIYLSANKTNLLYIHCSYALEAKSTPYKTYHLRWSYFSSFIMDTIKFIYENKIARPYILKYITQKTYSMKKFSPVHSEMYLPDKS